MNRRCSAFTGLAAAIGIGCPLAPAFAQEMENEPVLSVPFADDWASDESIVGTVAELNLPNLSGGIVVRLNVPAPASAVTIAVPMMEYKLVNIELQPISIREAGYELRAQLADGSWTVVEAGPEKTYTGAIREVPESQVAASLLSNGLFATIFMPDGSRRWIEPLSEHVAGAEAGLHVVYRNGDTLCAGDCGADSIPQDGPGGEAGQRGGCGGSICVAQIACDADWQYYNSRGSSVSESQDRISAIINVINHQYVREVAITHRITTILVRTAEPDPYTSFDASTLLDQFQDEWQTNQGGITRDVAHLFTGRELDGSTIGIAWVADICTSQSYGLSESNFSSSFACVSDLTAHELGHNWGANHCACTGSTMNPSITCANTFNNSGGQSSSEIDTYADTRPCLSGGAAPPANDTCATATYVYSNGTFSGSNVNATTDGGHTNCPPAGGGTNDVWWRYSPPASGTVELDTCGSAFDTVLSVHNSCPGTPDNLVVCNDDCSSGDCTSTVQSCVSFSAVAGRIYYIRVASYFGSTGDVTLHVSGPANPSGNSLCGNATAVSDGDTVFGSLFGTGNDGDATCGTSSTNRDVWYEFIAPCAGTLEVDSCGSNDFPDDDLGMDTVLSLHSACVGDTTNQLACNDDATGCTGASGSLYDSRVSAALTAGQNVKIRVSHFNNSFNNGYFRIHVDFTVTAISPVVTAIPNDTIPAGIAYLGPIPSLTNPACMGPVTWSLVAGPAGMTINAATGRVSWPSPTVVGSPHVVTIRATNGAGFDNESWSLTVTPGCPIAGCTDGGLDADLDNNCQISLNDLTLLLANFGTAGPLGDIDSNGSVGLSDLTVLLSRFGNICQ